jgi:probable HAF family extracellular repeat protein
MHTHITRRILLLVVVSLIFLCCNTKEINAESTHAFLWTSNSGMIDLGTLGGDFSQAYGINNLGQVVGMSKTSSGETHAFLWTQDAGMVDLGTLGGTSYATGINNSGQVVGASLTGSGIQHAFLWTASSGMKDLNGIGDPWSWASAINDSGQVVGTFGNMPFLWTGDQGIRILGSLGGSINYGQDINNTGTVVGSSSTASGVLHAFTWTKDEGMKDLGTLGSGGSRAEAINDKCEVVGSILNSGAAFLWTTTGGMNYLGIPGYEIHDINDDGWITGMFLWTPDRGMINLGTLGGTFTNAYAVNDLGQVVGWSQVVPEPSIFFLLCCGLMCIFAFESLRSGWIRVGGSVVK